MFHQYSPDWPKPDAPRGWGHFASDDLVHWRGGNRGFAIAPDTPDEASGAYSGCAVPTETGVRDLYDRGLVLALRSDDGLAWENAGTVRTAEPFGFMWECPDRVTLGGREWLSICPQGMQNYTWANGVRDQSGYIPLPDGKALSHAGELVLDAGHFRRWDRGFDFYAPQTFVDESGRTILIGWMGVPEVSWESAPNGLTWCHCLTVPREVSAGTDGALLQLPVRELETLRGAQHELKSGGTAKLPEHRADVLLDSIERSLKLELDGALRISWDGSELSLGFGDDAVGCGRTIRTAACDSLRNLRVLVDSSAVEVFASDGELAFATRWFPRSDTLELALEGAAAAVWEMGDGMAGTY